MNPACEERPRPRPLARHLQTNIDRLVTLGRKSTLDQIEAAFTALGKRVDIEVRPLFLPQRVQRMEAGGAVGGQIAGSRCHHTQKQGRAR